MNTGGRGRGLKEKLFNKNAIRHEYRGPPDFLTTPSTPLKRIYQKTSRTPPPLPQASKECESVGLSLSRR